MLEGLRRSPLRGLAGVALVLVGAGSIVMSTAFRTPISARLLGPDAPVDAGAFDARNIDSNNSPTLDRNPLRPGNLALANRIDTPRYACALHVSFDGGVSWRGTPIPLPPGEERKCFAPDLAFASDGRLYLSFVTLKGRGNVPHAVWLTSSTDGGRTLSPPIKALGDLAFQVRLAVERANPRRVHLTWVQGGEIGFLRFSGTDNPIMSERSDDGGTTWGAPVRVSSLARRRVVAPSPVLGARGELYVLYLDLGDDRLDYDGGHGGEGGPPYRGTYRLVLGRSLDGGSTWGESVVDPAIRPIGRFVVFYPAYPSIAVDRRSGRIYVAYHDARDGDPDVLVWSLAAGGTKRSRGPVRVNATRRHDGTAQYLPRLAVAPDGRLDIVYYDRRADPRNIANRVSLQSSDDAGRSFGPAVTLASRRFDSRIGFGSKHGLADLGSRLALISDDRRALAVWTDTRAGTIATNKQDLVRAVVAFSAPARLSATAKGALRYGGAALALLGIALLFRATFAAAPQPAEDPPEPDEE